MTFVGHGSEASQSDGKVIEFLHQAHSVKPASSVTHI